MGNHDGFTGSPSGNNAVHRLLFQSVHSLFLAKQSLDDAIVVFGDYDGHDLAAGIVDSQTQFDGGEDGMGLLVYHEWVGIMY